MNFIQKVLRKPCKGISYLTNELLKRVGHRNYKHFIKIHIGVDNQTKLIHSVVVTTVNAYDSQLFGDLLHGDETRFWGNFAYVGRKILLYDQTPNTNDFIQKQGSHYRKLTQAEQPANSYKSKIRSRVEHVFGMMKHQFGFTKVRYRGLDKNPQCVFTKHAQVHLFLAKKILLLAI